jgi:hypothetical protein
VARDLRRDRGTERVVDRAAARPRRGLRDGVPRRGPARSWGGGARIDLSAYALSQVHPSVSACCRQASIADDLPEQYDLIVNIEVFPHVEPAVADVAVANFCRHANDVLFSSSPADPAVRKHVNLAPPEHWAEVFARHRFYRDMAFDATFVTPWAVRYRRSTATPGEVIPAYERWVRDVTSQRDSLDQQLASLQQQLAAANDTIRHMERSWFWRARRPWSAITGR